VIAYTGRLQTELCCKCRERRRTSVMKDVSLRLPSLTTRADQNHKLSLSLEHRVRSLITGRYCKLNPVLLINKQATGARGNSPTRNIMQPRTRAKRVMIDGELFVIEKTLYTHRNGWKFLLSGAAGKNCRTCPAFPPNIRVRTEGEELIFDC
jgi:hypothetical protein